MTCVELQQSLAEMEDGSSAEQQAHLRTCRSCAALVEELARIIEAAPALLDSEEPSPRVWNSIEIQLRREGLIRAQRADQSPISSLAASAFGSRLGWARLLVPATALLVLVGIWVNQRSRMQPIPSEMATTVTAMPEMTGLNDAELLQEVSARTPAMKAQYADNLRRVNDYIADAQKSVDADPNDADARRSLMDAYEEKSMLFDLAVDRSQP